MRVLTSLMLMVAFMLLPQVAQTAQPHAKKELRCRMHGKKVKCKLFDLRSKKQVKTPKIMHYDMLDLQVYLSESSRIVDALLGKKTVHSTNRVIIKALDSQPPVSGKGIRPIDEPHNPAFIKIIPNTMSTTQLLQWLKKNGLKTANTQLYSCWKGEIPAEINTHFFTVQNGHKISVPTIWYNYYFKREHFYPKETDKTGKVLPFKTKYFTLDVFEKWIPQQCGKSNIIPNGKVAKIPKQTFKAGDGILVVSTQQ